LIKILQSLQTLYYYVSKFAQLAQTSDTLNISDSDIPPAKHVLSLAEGARRAPSSDEKYCFFFFAAFASLREIFRFFWLRRSRAVPQW
jgi:hypothetical protein